MSLLTLLDHLLFVYVKDIEYNDQKLQLGSTLFSGSVCCFGSEVAAYRCRGINSGGLWVDYCTNLARSRSTARAQNLFLLTLARWLLHMIGRYVFLINTDTHTPTQKDTQNATCSNLFTCSEAVYPSGNSVFSY